MAAHSNTVPASGCEPTIFNFHGRDLRVIERDGDPWFVAKDVTDGLGLGNITEALRDLDEDELSSEILNSGSQGCEMRLIYEPGFYKLVGRSRKPAAKRFDRWVRHEVLPAIRKTGSYAAPEPTTSTDARFERVLTLAEKLVEALTITAAAKPTDHAPALEKPTGTKRQIESGEYFRVKSVVRAVTGGAKLPHAKLPHAKLVSLGRDLARFCKDRRRHRWRLQGGRHEFRWR